MFRSRLSLCFGAAALGIGAFVFFPSCTKEKTNKTTQAADTEDVDYAADNALSEKTYDDASAIADEASLLNADGALAYKTTATTLGGCASVTRVAGLITIDFGPVNCLCRDGRNRRGKIIVRYTGAYADSGSVHSLSFEDYYQNDNHIEGTKTVTNMGRNTAGNTFFNVELRGRITRTSGAVAAASWARVRTWIAGGATPRDRSDDVYSITGTGTLTRTPAGGTATSASVEVTDRAPLIVAADCRWVEAGTVTYTMPGGRVRSLNYGDVAACDDRAQITTPAGAVRDITLP